MSSSRAPRAEISVGCSSTLGGPDAVWDRLGVAPGQLVRDPRAGRAHRRGDDAGGRARAGAARGPPGAGGQGLHRADLGGGPGDRLVAAGWRVGVADARKLKAPLAAETDRLDARRLATPCFRDLVPAVWPPSPPERAPRGSGSSGARTRSACAPRP